MPDTVTIIYNGGMPELLTAQGHTIIRGEPITLPADLAEALIQARPEEFERVKE